MNSQGDYHFGNHNHETIGVDQINNEEEGIFNGQISNLQIYNRALTSRADILRIIQGLITDPDDVNLQAFYDFRGPCPTNDKSGN